MHGAQVWVPGKDAMEEGEVLDYDPSAYDCLHALSLDWPCLRSKRFQTSTIIIMVFFWIYSIKHLHWMLNYS